MLCFGPPKISKSTYPLHYTTPNKVPTGLSYTWVHYLYRLQVSNPLEPPLLPSGNELDTVTCIWLRCQDCSQHTALCKSWVGEILIADISVSKIILEQKISFLEIVMADINGSYDPPRNWAQSFIKRTVLPDLVGRLCCIGGSVSVDINNNLI